MESHRLISAEELSPSEETVDWCAWCGAVACTVHACEFPSRAISAERVMVLMRSSVGFVAYNRQTKPKKALPQPTSNEADSCDRCGQERCLMNSKLVRLYDRSRGHVFIMLTRDPMDQDRMNLDDAPREPPERLKGLDACTLSLILEQPFENVRWRGLRMCPLDADQSGYATGPGNSSSGEPCTACAVVVKMVEAKHTKAG
jgi:hypothetical protein